MGYNLIYASSGKDADDDDSLEVEGSFYIQSHKYAKYALYTSLLKKTYENLSDFEKSVIDTGPHDPAGMRINLKTGNITSYDFSLRGISAEKGYEGSYILLNSSPELTVMLNRDIDEEGEEAVPSAKGVKLLTITPSSFVMHSNDWGSYTDKVVIGGTKGSAKANEAWNIRKQPGTNSEKTGKKTTKDKTYTIYATGTGTDDGSNTTWFKIGTNQWVTKRAFYTSSITLPVEPSSKEVSYKYGMEFNVNKGVLKMYKGDRVLRIAANDSDTTYGIKLGTYEDGKETWNLCLGWDGTIQGNGWIIDENGWRKK